MKKNVYMCRKRALEDIEIDSQNKVTKSFGDYSKLASEAKYKTIHEEAIRVLALKQMPQ